MIKNTAKPAIIFMLLTLCSLVVNKAGLLVDILKIRYLLMRVALYIVAQWAADTGTKIRNVHQYTFRLASPYFMIFNF